MFIVYNSTRNSMHLIDMAKCNDPPIGSYNNYHLSPNGIPSANQRWYGLVYLVYKWLVNLVQGLGNS